MKFCYIDESGIEQEKRFAVMAGIIVDAKRMHITKNDWSFLLQTLSGILPRPIKEIHTADFYSGNGIWRGIDGQNRAKIIDIIFKWLDQRKHEIVYTAVDKDVFISHYHNEKYAREVPTLWRFMALHICLAIQRRYQRLKRGKGNTLFIFDNQKTEAENFIELIGNVPEWTDSYYQRGDNQERLDQMIDAPYFGDSRHVSMIQLADFVSFFIRKHIELRMGITPDHEDEPNFINKWATVALNQAIPTSAIYPKIGRCQCAELFYRYAPSCLLE